MLINGHEPPSSSEPRTDVMKMIFFTADFFTKGKNAEVTWIVVIVLKLSSSANSFKSLN